MFSNIHAFLKQIIDVIEEEWKFNYATLKISFTKETSTNVYNRCD